MNFGSISNTLFKKINIKLLDVHESDECDDVRAPCPLFAMNGMRAVREWTSWARLGGSVDEGGSVEESAEIRKVVDPEVTYIDVS